MDLESSYGTYLEGKGKLLPNVPMELNVGDTFYLGDKNNGFTMR